VTQRLHVTGAERIDVTSLPSWQDRFVVFHGSFEFTLVDGGTRVRHAYRFEFRPPLRWLAEPYLRGFLARNIGEEVDRMKSILEA
jgi:hypothetical protein